MRSGPARSALSQFARSVTADWVVQPGTYADTGPTGGRASFVTRASSASPEVFGCIDRAGTRSAISSTHIRDANFAIQQIVQMSVQLGGSIGGDRNVFVLDDVSGDDGSADWGTASTTVDVDAGRPRGRRIIAVGAVARDEIANDHIP